MLLSLLIFSATPPKIPKLKPIKHIRLHVPESSDICRNPLNDNFFVVSDDGILFEVGIDGVPLREAKFRGFDFEAVHADETHVFLVEEYTRKIRVFDQETLTLQRTVYLPYGGGRNKSYEAFTFNPVTGRYILLTEKDPIYLFELDSALNVVNEWDMNHLAADISAATFHEGHLWLLSDEDMHVIKLDPVTFEESGRWYVPVINPEGLVFDGKGRMLIVSDDMERLYFFDTSEM